jgi:uncharacterized protein (UPF0276 family)
MSFSPLGFGLGLRKEHYTTIIDSSPDVDWFEILTENYLVPGGKPLYYLDQISERYPVVMHGVSMSLGSVDPLDMDYLKQVKELAERTGAKWVSDHMCFTGVDGINAHDLLPLPFTEEAVKHISEKIKQAQDFLGRQILVENASTYITYKQSDMTEWDFTMAVAEESDSLILLDVNNIYVSSVNHGFDPLDYLDGISTDRVQQHHIAGHSQFDGYIIDTHDHDVVQGVWDLYAEAIKRYGEVSVMIERDDNIPELPELLSELQIARDIYAMTTLESSKAS